MVSCLNGTLSPSALPLQSPSLPLFPCFLPSLFNPPALPHPLIPPSLPLRFPRLLALFPPFCLSLLVFPLVSNSSFLSLNRRKLYNALDLTCARVCLNVCVCLCVCVFASGWDVNIHTNTHILRLWEIQKQTDIFSSWFAWSSACVSCFVLFFFFFSISNFSK